MINISLFMRDLCRSIADCPYLSDEVADCSTSLPDSTRRVAQAIAAKRNSFLDAAMAGDFGYKTQFFPRLLSSFNRLSGAS